MEADLVLSSLGRPFVLGMLYDRRTDKIIPAYSPWKRETLEKNLTVNKQLRCMTEVVVDDSFEKKSANLEIDANLKLSIMARLVKVDGIFKHLHDHEFSTNQARVTLKYCAMTHYKSLSMEHLRQPPEYPEALDHDGATHVVTAIQYGIEAYFVFDRSCSARELKNEVTANMKTSVAEALKLIGNPDGSISVNSKPGNSKSKQDRITCQYYGDTPLPRLPLTYEDAAKTCQELAKLREDSSVPKVVHLQPLYKLKRDYCEMRLKIHTVSEFLVATVEKIFESVHKTKARCKDLMSDKACTTFQVVREQISEVEDLLKQFKIWFSSKLSQLIPEARETGKEEGLKDLLGSVNMSPFAGNRLDEYVKAKTKELRILERERCNFKECKYIHEAYTNETGKLHELIHNRRYQKVFAFVFNVTTSSHSCIDAMKTFLTTGRTLTPDTTTQLERFDDGSRYTAILSQRNTYLAFADDNKRNEKFAFVVTESLPGSRHASGPTIVCFENGVSNEFDPFPPPGEPQLIAIEEEGEAVYISWHFPASHHVDEFHLHYKSSDDDKWQTVTTAKDIAALTDLRCHASYTFRVQGESKEFGLTPMSDESKPDIIVPKTDLLD